MAKASAIERAEKTVSSPAISGPNGPLPQPGEELVTFLRNGTPRGASALRCHVPETGGFPLPLTAPTGAVVTRTADGVCVAGRRMFGVDWLSERLAELLPGEGTEHREGRDDLAAMLDPGARTAHGMPVWSPGARPSGALARILSATLKSPGRTVSFPAGAQLPGAYSVVRNPSGSGRGQRGPRADARGIMAAAASDLCGLDLTAISEMLGLSDHLQTAKPRKAGDYCARGRKLLTQLGVWPWAHLDLTGAKAAWTTRPEAVDAFVAWHAGAIAGARAELERAAALG